MNRIRARAHEIWEAEGRPEGRELEIWLRAETDIVTADSEPIRTSPPRA